MPSPATSAEIEHSFDQTVAQAHGRVEVRRCWTMAQVEYLVDAEKWQKFTSIAMIQPQRRLQGRIEYETPYDISSLTSDAARLSPAVRSHWLVENPLHWVLDLAVVEDTCRVRKDFAPENLAVVPRIALNLLSHETSLKLAVKNKRLRAGWDEDYLLKFLVG